MKTKPKGIHANFRTDCHCGAEITVSNGRVDSHNCERPHPITLADIRAALTTRQETP
jgi:hypothetical protein